MPVTRIDDAGCWSIELPDRRVRVTDSWLAELGMAIEEFVGFYERYGYWPWKKPSEPTDMTIPDLYGY